MNISIDESEPEDSIQRYFAHVVATGEEALKVPPHWHKVLIGNTSRGSWY